MTAASATAPPATAAGRNSHRFLEAWDGEAVKWDRSGTQFSATSSLTPNSYFAPDEQSLGAVFHHIADAISEMLRRQLAGVGLVTSRGFLVDEDDTCIC